MPLLQAVYGITAVERTFPKFVYDDNNKKQSEYSKFEQWTVQATTENL